MWPVKSILTKQERLGVAAAIAEAEKTTAGEIRVVIRHARHRDERSLSLHDIALREFHRLGMEKTHGRTGVLILILVPEKQFRIIADEGIHREVEEGTWDAIAASMSSHFREGKFAHGITDAVAAAGSLLAAHFPRQAGDTNELSNDVVER